MDIEDEKILKLNKRMNQPLPTYKKSQINRTRFCGNEPVLQTLLTDSNEISVGSKINQNSDEALIENCSRSCNSKSASKYLTGQKSKLQNQKLEKTIVINKMKQETQDVEKNIKIMASEKKKPKLQNIEDEVSKNSSDKEVLKKVKSDNSSNSIQESHVETELDQNKNKITNYFKSAPNFIKTGVDLDDSERILDFSSAQIIIDEKSSNQILTEKEKGDTLTDVIIKEKDKEISSLCTKLQQMEDRLNSFQEKNKGILSKLLVELETYKRFEKRTYVNSEKSRIGEYVPYREGSKFKDVWIDGYELKNLKQAYGVVSTKREALEVLRKKIKRKRPTTAAEEKPCANQEPTIGLLSSYTNAYSTVLQNMPTAQKDKWGDKGKIYLNGGTPFPTGFGNDLSDSSNQLPNSNERTCEERKEQLQAQIVHLIKEENYLKEKIESLEKEKEKYIKVAKHLFEEDNCRFGKVVGPESTLKWPVLNNRYQLVSLLGKGGFSEVYYAFDCEVLQEVACKIHQLNTAWSEQQKSNYIKHALRENQVHKVLSHPNIVTHYDSVEIDSNSFCTVLEYCSGPDLSTLLKKYKTLSEKESKSIVKQILSALKFLNESGRKIIHYDLKPQNILFHEGMIKISDFGLCKIISGEETRLELTSQGVGTYWYLPPECFSQDYPKISTKVDIWSIGVIFYEMLFGFRPFGHEMSQERILKEGIMLKAYSFDFPAKPAVSTEIKDFIKKCLEYNQELRLTVFEAYNLLSK